MSQLGLPKRIANLVFSDDHPYGLEDAQRAMVLANLKDYEEAALQKAIAPIAKLSSPLNFADPEAIIQAQIYICRGLLCARKDVANNHPPLWSTPRVHHGQRFLQVTKAHATAMKNWVPRIGAYPWAARIDVESWKEAKKRHRQTRKKYPLHPNGSPLYISSPRRPIKTSFGCMYRRFAYDRDRFGSDGIPAFELSRL
ncbi:hypothetical protein D9611_002890 [Ephemerocybe angulata]|uniref:Uncharacterized protein n=1 Tax=Ephemerocybe angulata TaxID=980116 RepID=A0A8H5C8M6_9AGAR|nr:hypothetical protein D9611_002890 [Tulosesus angulatus]